MATDVIERWLKSRSPARIDGLDLKPVAHAAMTDTPLSIQRGQATVYVLSNGEPWFLKKFLNGRQPDRDYLLSIRGLLPTADGFACGTERRVLDSSSLVRERGAFHEDTLRHWLDGTLLMPQVRGTDWSSLADRIRAGEIELDPAQRLTLCEGLAVLTDQLEKRRCAHRDFSAGNVFIDTARWTVHLIDFDSVYHPALDMPAATTCGTEGYTPPYAWRGGSLDPQTTWSPGADRYALGLLAAEFLTARRGSPLTAEGGMFCQQELRARTGAGIEEVRKALAAGFPQITGLFDAVIGSSDSATCPSPQEWLQALGPTGTAPALDELEADPAASFQAVLSNLRPPAPLWPAPALSDLPEVDLLSRPVRLPDDPWRVKP